MPLNSPVPGGEESAKSPMERDKSVLGSNSLCQTRKLRVNDNGQAEVVIVDDQTGDTLLVGVLDTNETALINDGVTTTIITYVAPSANKISKISVSGTGPADFTLELNTVKIDTKRTDTGNLNSCFDFKHPLSLIVNDVLGIKVNHCAIGKTRKFESTIYGV